MSDITAPDTGVVGSIPVPILGTIQDLLDFLVKVPLIGSLFKGKTQHVDYDTALSTQRTALARLSSIYDSVDADGQALLRKGANDYWEKYVYPGFSSWWGGRIAIDSKTWSSKDWLDNGKTQFLVYGSMPLFYFLSLEDAVRVQATVEERYTSKVKYYILDPLQKYLEVKYGTSIDENLAHYEATKTPAGSSSLAGIDFKNPMTLLVIGGVLVGGFLLWKKR